MATTLVVSNDFPPRIGGIESFVADVCALLDNDVVVLTSSAPGAQAHDRALPYPVFRTAGLLLPTRSSTRTAVDLLRSSGATRVVFGAAAPLSLMAGPLRSAGALRQLGLSHGHETWWASVPGARTLLRRMADELDHLATISDYAAGRIAPALSASARQRMIRLAPPVDTALFRPDSTVRERPRCVAVGRFVTQKGFVTLLEAWQLVVGRWPASRPRPELVLVGDGPLRRRLNTMVTSNGLAEVVRFTGPLPRAEVVGQLRASDVFALPVRTRLAGLNPEGLGLGFIEAAACGLPVVVGDSGGAPETVLHGRSGYVVRSTDHREIAARLSELLTDPDRARRMGRIGREHVVARYGSDQAGCTLRQALEL
jgi:phosphatidylinositol alpha-1,6-mannosyltransferase